MSSIVRALDYEPQNHDVLEMARLIVWGCIGVYHTCREPLTEVQINDPRLDSFFSECAICSIQWIPSPSAFEPWISDGIVIAGVVGGYCHNCKKAFCRKHVADPLPEIKFGITPHCPSCGCDLDCHHAFGRKARQAPRLNKRLSCVVLVRDGFVPPDKEYCLKVFRSSSSDVLEDLPCTIGMDLQPWEYQAERVLEQVRSWLKTKPQYNAAADQIAIWSGLDTETKTRFHLIKIWGPSHRVTLDNLFTIPQCSKNFSFETATLSGKSFPKSQTVSQNRTAVDTDRPPNVMNNHSSAAVVQEFIDLFLQFFFEGLADLANPSKIEPSQHETLTMTVVNRAGDVIMRKYNLSEQEAAKIAEQAIKSMANLVSGKIDPVSDVPAQKDIPPRRAEENRGEKLLQELFEAVEQGRLEQVKDLLSRGVDVMATRPYGDTPLHVAAFQGHTEIAQQLITKGAEVNAGITSATDAGATPLHLGAMKGHMEVVALLLRNGAKVGVKLCGGGQTSTSGATPLHIAATHNQINVVSMLVKSGANLEAKDDYGDTALHYASNGRLVEMVRELMRLGANVGVRDNYGRTPLSLAEENRATSVVQILRSAGTH